jgi:tRNA pseudouridine55 synthase
MYSALKHEGQPLYALARQGIEIERAPRPATVYALDLLAWNPPELELRMRVSKGTYVRSIAHDLGQALGVGAHLTALEREAVGRFLLEDAERLARVVEAFVEGWWPSLLHPLDTALLDYNAMVVDAAAEAALRNGQQVQAAAPSAETTPLVRVYNADGRFVGLVRWDGVTGRWQPERIFPVVKPAGDGLGVKPDAEVLGAEPEPEVHG